MLSTCRELSELVLEYVSGFSDVGPLGLLPSLQALHLENLRNVDDFSGLGLSSSLKYLSIDGTIDWSQPVSSLEFLGSMEALEHLRLMHVRTRAVPTPLMGLLKLKKIRKIDFSRTAFSLDVYAWLEAKLSHLEGSMLKPSVRFLAKDREIATRDIRSQMPAEEFAKLSGLYVAEDGRRYEKVPHQAVLLGKGERYVSGSEQQVGAKCDAHDKRYRALVKEMEQQPPQ